MPAAGSSGPSKGVAEGGMGAAVGRVRPPFGGAKAVLAGDEGNRIFALLRLQFVDAQ